MRIIYLWVAVNSCGVLRSYSHAEWWHFWGRSYIRLFATCLLWAIPRVAWPASIICPSFCFKLSFPEAICTCWDAGCSIFRGLSKFRWFCTGRQGGEWLTCCRPSPFTEIIVRALNLFLIGSSLAWSNLCFICCIYAVFPIWFTHYCRSVPVSSISTLLGAASSSSYRAIARP